MKKLFLSMIPDGLIVIGATGLAIGAWMIYHPAGFIVGGTLALAAGVLCARIAGK